MCGIAGFIGKGNEDILRRMIKTLEHRGPDFLGADLKEGVGLAQARLSILDLSSNAHQPFYTEDGRYGIVFNGEIYNYIQLKEELAKHRTFSFRSTSDTEVLLYLYIVLGEKMLPMLNGMFAFVIYDFLEKKAFIARDRMGKKPFYYAIKENTLVFGSELKALLVHPLVSRKVNLSVLNEYLTYDYVPTPHAILEDVKKLDGGHFMVFQNGKITEEKAYYTTQFHPTFKGTFVEAKTQLGELLDDATAARLVADVPLGVFLSGGLDSSTIAYYAQKNAAKQINTFSIGFSNKSYDESDYAALVAKKLGTEHHVEFLEAQDSLDLLPFITERMDEPFADPSIIPTYLLSKFTRSKVTVALGGDGSDELLAGYPTFISDRYKQYYSALPNFLKSTIKGAVNWLPPSDKNISLDFKINQFLKGFDGKPRDIHTLWLSSFTPTEKTRLFSAQARVALKDKTGLELIDEVLVNYRNETTFHQTLQTYFKTYLQDDILVKVDRASMLTSLEVRAPFLDYRVVDFINTLPNEYKIKGNNGKYVLKELMRDKLPNEIIDRPKKGFGIPLSLWLRNELRGLCDELLSEENLKKHQLFDVNYVKQLQKEHYSQRKNHRKELWNLMVFQGWYLQFMA